MSITYISWAADCSRSDHTARELGGVSRLIYWKALGSRPSTIWLKYLGQALWTWRVLLGDRPSAVFVMTPPVFAALTVWIYCAIRRCRFVQDAHSGAFLDRRWRAFQWLQFWLCRRAATTIVHNDYLRSLVEQNGGQATLVSDIPVRFNRLEPYPLPSGFNVAVVCSFTPDEPIAEVLAAAAATPDVHFHVTGDTRYLGDGLKRQAAPNVTLTGFLSRGAYGTLVRNADAVMALTKNDHTMLRGAWEATYQGTPVIVSNWGVLRQAFDEGAVHVDNTPEGIASGVREMQRHIEDYRAGATVLMLRKQARWIEARDELCARVGGGPAMPRQEEQPCG